MKKKFENLKKYSEASGLAAIVDQNIKMEMNEYGLYEESIIDPQKNIDINVSRVIPNFNNEVSETDISNELYSSVERINYDSRIGFYKSLYVGHVVEGDYRLKASSGGMGTWIFKELFEKNLIDYVIHVRPNSNSKSSTLFKYEISSNLNEINSGAKTRYYPVELSGVIRTLKSTPGRYAVVGIPSFIYGLRLLAKTDKEVEDRIKFTVGLICGHQKSSKFAESMAWQVGIKPGNLIDIDFRHKFEDRPASHYGVKFTGLIDNELRTIIKPTTELFGQNWGWGFFKPEASNFTDDVFNETADIVLGDAWLPEYTSDSSGNNVVIIRNSIIDSLVNEAITNDRLKMDIVNKETIFKSQSSHYRHTHDELAYRLYKKDLKKKWRPQKRVNATNKIPLLRRKVQDLRTEISKQSHLKYADAVNQDNFDVFIESMNLLTNKYNKLYRFMNIKNEIDYVKKMDIKTIFKKIIKKIFRKK